MKIKFNFGTGIFLFMALFMTALIVFVIFAHRQDVNLVHDNYYEKGVDHNRQMQIAERSAVFYDAIEISDDGNFVRITFPAGIAPTIQNGNVTFFRPSDHLKDIREELTLRGNVFISPKEKLIPGRYVVKIAWQINGLDYEVDKPFTVK